MIRRAFINRWGRLLLLGSLAGAAGYLTLAGKVTGDSSCAASGKCRNCAKSKNCKVMKAINTSHNGRR